MTVIRSGELETQRSARINHPIAGSKMFYGEFSKIGGYHRTGGDLAEANVEPVRGEGWNIFRHEADRELWCAVPPHRPIPGFLFSGQWVFSRHDIRSSNALPEFRDRIAEHAVHLKGFYLFHRFEAEVLKAASVLETSGVLAAD